jgi:hypothetical protein
VAADIRPEFKRRKRWRRKEEVLELEGYSELERHIMRMMREHAAVEAVA